MIKINVILNNKEWYRYIKNPTNFIDKKIQNLNNKFTKYKKKIIFCTLLLSGNNEIKKLNKKITPKEIATIRKQFRSPIIARSIYSEVLNIIQPTVIKKLQVNKNPRNKQYLNDALLTSIAGISAAMKNTG